jgi:RNA polymerase sigma-70 factor (ECF subfamily)
MLLASWSRLLYPDDVSDDSPRRDAFPTTRISLILAARGESEPVAREALAALCRSYWYPIYAYLRRLGHTQEAAEDLTQGFFARVLEKHYFDDFERQRGRFRSYLLTALKHYVANERDRDHAQKRGGAVATLSLDTVLAAAETRYRLEPSTELTPERIFEQQWALAVLARVQERLAGEEADGGRRERYDRLKVFLTGEDSDVRYRTLAEEMQTTEGAIKVSIHRLRRRFKDLLREEISHTVAHADDVGDELRHLLTALRG